MYKNTIIKEPKIAQTEFCFISSAIVGPTLILDIIPTSSPIENCWRVSGVIYWEFRFSNKIFLISLSTSRPSSLTLYLVVIFNWFEAPNVLTSALPKALLRVDSISDDFTSLSNLTM